MGLGLSLSNALSGMRSTQDSVDVVSRNIASSGTPGYHRQSIEVIDYTNIGSSYARSSGVSRAFDRSLQSYYTSQVSDASAASVRAGFLDRLQIYLGKPGAPGSIDTAYNAFETSLQTLATSPDSYAARTDAVVKATDMAQTLSRVSASVQEMRQETEDQIGETVGELNKMLSALAHANGRILDLAADGDTRSAVLDQRDRLVSQIAEIVDVQVDFRTNGTVALTTRSGVGLLDVNPSTFIFEPAGGITATSLFDVDDSKTGVGTLSLTTPAGISLDLVKQNILQGGKLEALLTLRDKTLVETQSQLDEIAAGLALAMSTVTTAGTPATAGAASGFSIDVANLQKGNDLSLSYIENGVAKKVSIIRVDDPTKLPMDYVGADNVRIIGLDLSGTTAAAATALGTALGAGLAVSNPSGTLLQILDDGAAGTTEVSALSSRHTATGTQNGQLALPLFVDQSNSLFTNSLDGQPQKIGLAGRMTVNSAIRADNKLLVQFSSGGALGDAARADFLVERLATTSFTGNPTAPPGTGNYLLSGTVSQLISQSINFQGGSIASALSSKQDYDLAIESLDNRMQAAHGVNVDEEMARLMELQNAYAANARVVSIVQELLDTIMAI